MDNSIIIQSVRDKIYSALDALADGEHRTAVSLLERAAHTILENLQIKERRRP